MPHWTSARRARFYRVFQCELFSKKGHVLKNTFRGDTLLRDFASSQSPQLSSIDIGMDVKFSGARLSRVPRTQTSSVRL